jgi:hypothetical protein
MVISYDFQVGYFLENNMEIFFTVSLCNSSKMFWVGVEQAVLLVESDDLQVRLLVELLAE